jgi:hypothetical protein
MKKIPFWEIYFVFSLFREANKVVAPKKGLSPGLWVLQDTPCYMILFTYLPYCTENESFAKTGRSRNLLE